MAEKSRHDYAPDFVVPPGETLLETIEALGLSQADLAARTGRPRKTINEIIKGKAAITAETALQLEHAVGVPAKFWLNLEASYRAGLSRREEAARLGAQQEWLEAFPVAAMLRLGWISATGRDPIQRLRSLLTFFGVASFDAWRDVWARVCEGSYRRSGAFAVDEYALAAWLRKGELEAQGLPTRPFDARAFSALLDDARAMTRSQFAAVRLPLVERCAAAGVVVVFVDELPGTRVCGATRWLAPERALVQLSNRYRREDFLWFAFFHEAGHVLTSDKRGLSVRFDERSQSGDEARADALASDRLIPPAAYRAFVEDGDFGREAVLGFAERVGVGPGIVVGRLQHDRHLAFSALNELRRPLR